MRPSSTPISPTGFCKAASTRKPGGCSTSPTWSSCPTTSRAGTTAATIAARRSMPKGKPIYYSVPKIVRRGRQRRRALALGAAASHGAGARPPQRSPLAARQLPPAAVRRADAGLPRAVFPRRRRRQARGDAARTPCTRWARTRRSPGWPPASSGSSCPTSSTPSRSTSRSRPTPQPGYAEQALDALATDVREPPAVSAGRRVLEAAHRASSAPATRTIASKRLDQIVGNWGQFETALVAAGRQGRDGRLPLPQRQEGELRGPRDQRLEAARRREGLSAVQSRSSSTGRSCKSTTSATASSQENQQQYLGERVAAVELDLEPRPQHFDHRVTVATPLKKAGAYLVDGPAWTAATPATSSSGSPTRRSSRSRSTGKSFYFVADAVTGTPHRQARTSSSSATGRCRSTRQAGSLRIETTNFAELTDADGQVTQPARETRSEDFQWLVTARTTAAASPTSASPASGRRSTTTRSTTQTKVFAITDRPVYRPDQTVKFKFWVRQAKYDQPQTRRASPTSTFPFEIHNPRGEKVFTQTFTADAYGGFAGDVRAARRRDARRSTRSTFPAMGGGSFRVEEYKKPEFEVTVDAPTEPVHARREDHGHDQRQVLLRRAGHQRHGEVQGHCARSYDAALVSRRRRGTGSTAPATGGSPTTTPGIPAGATGAACGRIAWWWPARHDAAGGRRRARRCRSAPTARVTVEIDTALAKALHGDQDHQYPITAEVVDESRRTIVGTGNVLVARKPFKVFAWVDRGYYRVGDTVQANFSAQTLDSKPVAGQGQARRCCKITLRREAASRSKRRSSTWDLDTDAEGQAEQQIKASARRASIGCRYTLTDAAGPHDRRRLPLHRRRRGLRRHATSASTTSSWSPTSASTHPATRSSCRSTPTAPAAPCCCSCGRPTASTCRRRCSA